MIDKQIYSYLDEDGITVYYLSWKEPDKIIKTNNKYYQWCKCDRCGGQGGRDLWHRDNGICYKCGGSKGYYKCLKVYKTLATAERNLQKLIDKEAEKVNTVKKQQTERLHKLYGDVFYIYLDYKNNRTYYLRDSIKANGGKFDGWLKAWYNQVPDDRFYNLKIITSDFINKETEWLDYDKLNKLVFDKLLELNRS